MTSSVPFIEPGNLNAVIVNISKWPAQADLKPLTEYITTETSRLLRSKSLSDGEVCAMDRVCGGIPRVA
jgi:hypothetical protein